MGRDVFHRNKSLVFATTSLDILYMFLTSKKKKRLAHSNDNAGAATAVTMLLRPWGQCRCGRGRDEGATAAVVMRVPPPRS